MFRNSRSRSARFSPRARSSTKPLMEVRGLRSSWETVATNSLLRRSRRARSVTSRTVQTTPSVGPPSSAAVTASVRPARSTVTSPDSACSSGGSGPSSSSARMPGSSSGTRSAARGFSEVISPVGVAHHQRVAQALDGDRQAAALELDGLARAFKIVSHGVEGLAQVAQLHRPAGLHAALQVALRQAPAGAHQLVERPAHRADQRRHQAERRHQREDPRRRDRDQGAPGVRALAVARLRPARALAIGERRAGAAHLGELRGDPGDRGSDGGQAARLRLGRGLPGEQARAEKVIARQAPCLGEPATEGGGRLAPGPRGARPALGERCLLDHAGGQEVGRGGLQLVGGGQLVLVALARVGEAGDAQGSDDGERHREPEERDLQRARDGEPPHRFESSPSGASWPRFAGIAQDACA